MKLSLLMFSLIVSLSAFTQGTGKITGTVQNEKNIPAESVTIQLYNTANKKLAKTELSNANGKFEFEKVKEGKYYLQVSMSEFKDFISQEVVMNAATDNVNVATINLQTQPKSLTTVNVEVKKPFIEQKVDRTIVNVDASPSNAGATAMEVLEKSPNVAVDNNGNISLKGKQGVIVMLDGKPTYLSPADLANILKNMPASALDQIEIMTNPSAKYDASGNSGLINIKTKKNKAAGSNGNISIGNTTGLYSHNGKEELTWKPSFTLNYN